MFTFQVTFNCCWSVYRQTNVAHVENLDMKEINFNQSRKDLTEAKIHHMLTEVMAKPQLRQRKYR